MVRFSKFSRVRLEIFENFVCFCGKITKNWVPFLEKKIPKNIPKYGYLFLEKLPLNMRMGTSPTNPNLSTPPPHYSYIKVLPKDSNLI